MKGRHVMPKPLWVIGYDISCPKRLRRIHQYCATHGWSLQKSLYLFALSRTERKLTCDELIKMMNTHEDRLLCIPFSSLEGSFHLAPASDVHLIHDDPRLDKFVY